MRCGLAAVGALSGCVLAVPSAGATTWHVAISGNDGQDGSEASPWRTIQRCADAVQPGDVCRVHAGIYREAVTPTVSGAPNAPIRFEAAPGECVTISGTDPLEGQWTQHAGSIWKTPFTRTITQLFSNGKALNEARWPDAHPDDLVNMPLATTGVGTDANGLVAAGAPAGDWTGAMVYTLSGLRWFAYTRRVSSYDTASHRITFDRPIHEIASLTPRFGDPYYLFGSLLALDAEGEWFYDSAGMMLYLWAPGGVNPSSLPLEYKRRQLGFDVNGLSYVEIVGFRFFGTSIRLNGTDHATVDGIRAQYVSHVRETDGGRDGTGAAPSMTGSHNVWKNSTIARSAVSALFVDGTDNLVANNILHDAVYVGMTHAVLQLGTIGSSQTAGNLLIGNTVFRSGATGIFHNSTASRLLYNRVSQVGLINDDVGFVSAWGKDGAGTELAYNEVFENGAQLGFGLYFDAGSSGYIIHHNYIHDIATAGVSLSGRCIVANNTFARVGLPFGLVENTQLHTEQSRLVNNLFDARTWVRITVRTPAVADWGDYEAFVAPDRDWAHFTVPLASLAQPAWAAGVPLDLRTAQWLSWSAVRPGDFELEIDNITLEGTSPLLLADFESGSPSTTLSTTIAPHGSANSPIELTIGTPGAGATGGALRATGRAASSDSSSFSLPLAGGAGAFDLSGYSAISFDLRATSRYSTAGDKVLGVEGHNATCSDPLNPAAPGTCAIDLGEPLPPLTDGFLGGAPDIGAFESGASPWVAGARFTEDWTSCDKPGEAVFDLPPMPSLPEGGDGGRDAGEMVDAADDRTSGGSRAGCECTILHSRAGQGWAFLAGILASVALRRRSRAKESRHAC